MKLPDVNCKYGAPMGRRDGHPGDDPHGKCNLARVYLDSGGYDNGGAYWGHDKPLYLAQAEESWFYLRASTRLDARRIVSERWPNVRFYR